MDAKTFNGWVWHLSLTDGKLGWWLPFTRFCKSLTESWTSSLAGTGRLTSSPCRWTTSHIDGTAGSQQICLWRKTPLLSSYWFGGRWNPLSSWAGSPSQCQPLNPPWYEEMPSSASRGSIEERCLKCKTSCHHKWAPVKACPKQTRIPDLIIVCDTKFKLRFFYAINVNLLYQGQDSGSCCISVSTHLKPRSW